MVQLCHPDLRNDFPPLRSPSNIAAHNLPAQLTSFVGRQAEIEQPAGGAGRQSAGHPDRGRAGWARRGWRYRSPPSWRGEFSDGVWYVDLAPITAPEVVPVTVARALGLPDQPGRSTMDTLLRFVRDRTMLVVLDNCEHLLDASAALLARAARCGTRHDGAGDQP